MARHLAIMGKPRKKKKYKTKSLKQIKAYQQQLQFQKTLDMTKEALSTRMIRIVLTSWKGSRVALSCRADQQFRMSKSRSGGTYIEFNNTSVYVQETQKAIKKLVFTERKKIYDLHVVGA